VAQFKSASERAAGLRFGYSTIARNRNLVVHRRLWPLSVTESSVTLPPALQWSVPMQHSVRDDTSELLDRTRRAVGESITFPCAVPHTPTTIEGQRRLAEQELKMSWRRGAAQITPVGPRPLALTFKPVEVPISEVHT
jgi:hypothetical protein